MKNIYALILFLFLIFNISESKVFWEYVDTDEFDQNDIAVKIECIDSCDCILGSAYAGSLCKLLRTTDEGKTWNTIYSEAKTPPYPNPYYFRNFKYFSNTCLYTLYADGYIKHSSNLGKSWDTTNISGPYSVGQGLKCFSMPDSITGMACDVFGAYITQDGWKTWEFIPKPIGYFITNCWMFSKDTFAIIGNILQSAAKSPRGSIFSITYDRGKTWKIDSISDYEYLSSIYFLDKKNGWIAANKGNNVGDQSFDVILQTKDGGQTWTRIYKKENEPIFGLQDIAFYDLENGTAVGQFGKILRTIDGGITWTQEYLGKCPFSSKDEPPTMCITYAGKTPIIGTYGNGIYRLETASSIESKNHNRILFFNFTGNTFFYDVLEISDLYQLKIFDIIGNEMLSIKLENMSGIINLNLSSGIYLYSLCNQIETTNGKFSIVR